MNAGPVISPDEDLLRADPRLEAYRGTLALVTGGLGFVGSNVVRSLLAVGASVRVVDSLSPGQGGNRFNLDGAEDRVDLRLADIRDEEAMADAAGGCDFVFHLAARSSHLDVLEDPFPDTDVNVRGTLVVLEAVRKHAPSAKVVYSGTRSAYGLIQTTPVREDHPFLPTEANSANKGVADLYQVAYHVSHGMHTVSMRLTNTYGPRMLAQHFRQGFINWFVRICVEGGTFKLYGDGTQVRDLVYVDDTARAMMLAAVVPETAGQAFNIGSGRPTSLKEIAETLVEINPRCGIEYVPFPEDARRVEIGDYVADIGKITRVLGWQPAVDLREGLERSVRFLSAHREQYL